MTSEAGELGDLLRTAREAVGWGLPRMAKETGYSVPYLSKLETGGKPVRPWHIELYDRALGGDVVRRRALLLMGAGMVTPAMWAELELPTSRRTTLILPTSLRWRKRRAT